MPPSGYSQNAVAGEVQFAKVCFADLQREAENGKYPTFLDAVEAEVRSIRSVLENEPTTSDALNKIQRGSLAQILPCYETLLDMLRLPDGQDIQVAIDRTLGLTHNALTLLHIENGKMV